MDKAQVGGGIVDALFIGLGIFAVVCEIAGIIYLYRIWRGDE